MDLRIGDDDSRNVKRSVVAPDHTHHAPIATDAPTRLAARPKGGLTQKEQKVRFKNPIVLSKEIFESPELRQRAYYADQHSLIFCGDVREVLRFLGEAGVIVDCIPTSPPYYGQRDYGVVGQIGLERTPEEFISKLVSVFQDTRDLLNTTGSLWVNLGDTYWSGRGKSGGRDKKQSARRFGTRPQDRAGDGKLCRKKQLLQIPSRVAAAMQEDHWLLRNDNIWVKPNPVPDPVDDRSAKSHEHFFHFVADPYYYYSMSALGGQPLDTWVVPTSKGGGSHKATFPEELVRIPILATTPPGGVVLDPFGGSGTSLAVAKRYGFRSIGIDISEKSCEDMRSRLLDIDAGNYVLPQGRLPNARLAMLPPSSKNISSQVLCDRFPDFLRSFGEALNIYVR